MKSFLTGSHTVRVARIHLEVSLAVSDIGWFLAVVDSGRVAIVRKTVNTSCPLSLGSTTYQPINKLVNTDRQGELCEQTLSKNSSMSIKLVRKLINVHKFSQSMGNFQITILWTSGGKIEQRILKSCIKLKIILFLIFNGRSNSFFFW